MIVTVSVNANETVPTNSGLLAQSVEHRAFNPQVEHYLRENIREWIRQLTEDKSKESVETILNRMKNVVVE